MNAIPPAFSNETMNAIPPAFSNSPIAAAFVATTPASAAAHARARELFPGGVTHGTRYVRPHRLSIARAAGARKWDADGNEYVDYVGGHGALVLGHAHPDVTARVAERAVPDGALDGRIPQRTADRRPVAAL
jgi:glutamate-1-semialdehyde 2,1-aminomutase